MQKRTGATPNTNDNVSRDKMALDDNVASQMLYGQRNENLRQIERETGAGVHSRGNELTLIGDADAVQLARALLEQLYAMARRGRPLGPEDVTRAASMLRQDSSTEIDEVFDDTVLVSSRARPIAPKGLAQKRYIEAIRKDDIVFGIGPAGTGKTYLAMAMAVRQLMDKQIKRIVLCRPAVEAGEKLGFLPGSMEEKVNPYLRPLYDALHDMMDMDRAHNLVDRGVIEVAPLAFMRGRAQPLTSRVMTPSGWRQMGDLRVGDFVIGSNGRPTQVLGIFPQGKKDVFRVTLSDGASTICCAEHLWAVRTPEDKRDEKAARIVDTQSMIGKLRRNHQHRYELPVLSAPVRFEPRRVPLEPYSLGLLLGDGCITTKTTPSFTTADRELAAALEAGLGSAIQLVQKNEIDYVLRHKHGGRGGTRIPNPVTVALRDLGLAGTNSATKFVPENYLYNDAEVRLAVLQGLLDTDGGPVVQEGRSCRIQFGTSSARLRDDVIFLVRSLGGVAYSRIRLAEGRAPGMARGREVYHRSDAHIIDIRLPPGLQPFRLRRKAEKYNACGGGRPQRYIEAIEPAGIAETMCIRVSADDHLYVTDDFIITHNTLNDAFVILDEAQNTTTEQMKMFLTRLGFDSKAVITGDVTQIDLPTGMRSGLLEARDLLTGIPGISMCYFTEVDVVRHPLVQQIIKAYDKRAREKAAERAAEKGEKKE